MHRLTCLIFAMAVALSAADINDDLLEAARKGDLNTVKVLIEKGAPVEAKTPYGQTPLYLAAMNGHEAIVEYLIAKGAKTEVSDTFYKAPLLDFVLMRKHVAIARLIITKGKGNADEQLKTVSDYPDLVQLVLDNGKPSQAALDSTYEGALAENKKDVAELLKKAGAHEPAAAIAVDPKVLESYVGTFKTETFPLDIKVSVKEGKLYMQATGQPEFALKPKSPTVFAFVPANLEVEFDSPASFTLKQGDMTIKFKKAVTQ